MVRTLALDARFAGRHFQSKALFGQQWHTHFVPSDLLEFSEYARDHAHSHGSWLVMSIGLGALIWMTIIALIA